MDSEPTDKNSQNNGSQKEENNKHTFRLWQVLQSVLGAFIGVQSDRVRQRDFESGRAADFIIAGLLLAALFVGVLIGVVVWITS